MKQFFTEGATMLTFAGDWDAYHTCNALGAEIGIYPSRWQRPSHHHSPWLKAMPIWTGEAFADATAVLEDPVNFAALKVMFLFGALILLRRCARVLDVC